MNLLEVFMEKKRDTGRETERGEERRGKNILRLPVEKCNCCKENNPAVFVLFLPYIVLFCTVRYESITTVFKITQQDCSPCFDFILRKNKQYAKTNTWL